MKKKLMGIDYYYCQLLLVQEYNVYAFAEKL